MSYIELKMNLAQYIAQDNWSACVDCILDILSCREWEEEDKSMWHRKLYNYSNLLSRSTYSK